MLSASKPPPPCLLRSSPAKANRARRSGARLCAPGDALARVCARRGDIQVSIVALVSLHRGAVAAALFLSLARATYRVVFGGRGQAARRARESDAATTWRDRVTIDILFRQLYKGESSQIWVLQTRDL